jgi:SpoVK/Ycf46/Vps4 family AAA+-type ATPase
LRKCLNIKNKNKKMDKLKNKIITGRDNFLSGSKNVLFELQYNSSFPFGNYYLQKFEKLPNYFKFDKKFEENVIELFSNEDCFVKIHESRRINEKNKEFIESLAYESGENFYIIDREYDSQDDVYYLTLSVYYQQFEEISEMVEKIKKFVNVPKFESKIHLIVKSSYGGFNLSNFNVKKVSLDVETNYGKEFSEKSNVIIRALKDSEKTGLVMLHGLPGTGKSTYIKYLTNKIKKKFIFFPSNMTEDLTSPSFIDFMIEQKDSILVIEDAEKLIKSRDEFASNAISNLLNVTDGILGDIMKVKIIATHNTKREKIDEALLRKGRLIAEHEFGKLPEENVEKLFKKLKIDYSQKDVVPMTLTDIYNFKEQLLLSEAPKSKIGFK